MLKKTLLTLVLGLGLSSSLYAGQQLKIDMQQLSATMTEAQIGFFTNDKASTLATIVRLNKETSEILGNKKTITALLPDAVKYKASIAINSAAMISKYSKEIEDILNNKNMRAIDKEMKTQKAFINIQNQCFRCHNLVRDWK